MTIEGLGLKSLSRNIGATFGRQLLSILLNLLTVAAIARIYGPEGNGAYAVALLLPNMLATLLNLGIAPANVYYLGSAQSTVRQLLQANLRVFLLLTTIGVGIGSIILGWKGEQLFPGIALSMVWLALVGFPVGLLQQFLISLFLGLQKFRAYNLILIIQPLTLLVLVGTLTFLNIRNITLLIIAYLISIIVTLIITIIKLMPLLGLEEGDKPQGKFLRQTLGYGWKAHLSNILAFVNYKADIFLTNFFLGPTAVGIYVIAVALAEKLWLLSQAVSTVLLPRLSQLSSDEDKRKRLTPIISRWVLVITFVGALLLAALAGPLITLVFGMNYLDAMVPLWILLPGIVLTSASRIMANDIAARGRPELNMYPSAVVVLVNVTGNLILIPTYGLAGAATATTVAYALNLLLRLIIYTRFTANFWADTLFVKPNDIRMLITMIQRL